MSPPAAVSVRRAADADLPTMTSLYGRFAERSIVNFDVATFSVGERRRWFSQFAETGRRQAFVAEIAGVFAGYAASMRYKDKPAYETSVETTIYVDPQFPRRGVGTALYAALFRALADQDVHRALAGVVLPNEASLALHRRFGFADVGVFHEVGRKFGRYHDVLWLEKAF